MHRKVRSFRGTIRAIFLRMKDKTLSPELDKIELHPDAWERTERAIKVAAGHAPIHRNKPQAAKPKRSVVRVKRKD